MVLKTLCRSALLLPACVAANPAMAQSTGSDGGPLSMIEAVQMAVAQHPSVRGAGQQLRQSGAAVAGAKAGYKPQISGGLDNQINSYRGGSYDSRLTYNATIKASQMLYDFGKVAGAVSRAQAEVAASEAQVTLAMDDIARASAQAWLDAYLYQNLLDLNRDHLAAVQSITALVAERAAKGATTRSDLEQANSRVAAVQSQMLALEADVMRARLALMYLTGGTAPVRIIGEVPLMLQGDMCAAGTDADTPAVRIAEAQRDAAVADWKIARAERMPTLSADGSAGYALTKGSRLYGDYRTTGQVGLNMTMPLYQGGGVQAKADGALYQLRYREDTLRQTLLELRQTIADATAQRAGWAARAPVLAARASSIDVTRGLYRQQYLLLGTRTLLELLNSEQEYNAARIDMAQGDHVQRQLALTCLYFQDQMRSQFGLETPSLDDQPPVEAAFIGPLLPRRN